MLLDDYTLWLNQDIWINGLYKEKRRTVLRTFAESIETLFRKKGYPLDGKVWKGVTTLGEWLYPIYVRLYTSRTFQWPLPSPYHRNLSEDYDQYVHIIDMEFQENVVEHWKRIEDFDPDLPMGNEVWSQFRDFMYIYIDIDGSKYTQMVDMLVYGSDNESESGDDMRGWSTVNKKKETNQKSGYDIYVQEAEQGYHAALR